MSKDKKELKKRKVYVLKLTQLELLHLRDLFSVMLPPDMGSTLSQALAQAEERPLIETRLWRRLSRVCREAGIPLDEDAPDFIVAPSGFPPMGVFRMAETAAPTTGAPEGEGHDLAAAALDFFDTLGGDGE